MRNVIAFILIALLSNMAFGFAGGTGTLSNPYRVSTVADLAAVNDDLQANYLMINDIDLAGASYSHSLISQVWYSSGSLQGNSFGGTFNGNGYVIRNLSITESNSTYVVGLFSCIGSGVVKNLGIIGANVSGGNATGGLVGKCYGTISNCYVIDTSGTGRVYSSSTSGVGGLAGTSGGGSIIEDSWADIDVEGYSQVGGLVGQIRSITTNCYAKGDVQATLAATVNYAGGFAGRQEEGSITNCYATGNVTTNGYRFGGFVGFQNNNTSMSQCYATGNVTGTNTNTGTQHYGGGFVGQSDGASSMISYCYSTGDVHITSGNRVGAFAGQVINLSDSYSTGSITGYTCVGGLVGLAGLGNGSADAQIIRCYATGRVNGAAHPTGGFLGYNYASNVTMVDCFWDTETSGTIVGVEYGSSSGVTGKTTAQMKTKSTFTSAGWDFSNNWLMLTSTTPGYPGYPQLSSFWQIDSFSICDFNKDGIVALDDFSVLASEWLTEASLVQATQEGNTDALMITHGPYLQHLRDDSVIIMWTTSKNCVSHVEWGFGSTVENTTSNSHHGLIDANTTLHKIRIEGLQPGTNYVYRVVSEEILELQPYSFLFGQTVVSATHSFTTLDENKSAFTFYSISDIHENAQQLDWILTNAGTTNTDFVIYNGDMINYYVEENQIFDDFIDVSVKRFAHEKPFVFVMGNHEVRGDQARNLDKYFLSPEGNFYYTFRQGPVHFTIMDSGEDKADDDEQYGGLVDFDNYRNQQLQWFQQQVAQTAEFQNAAFRVVLSHIPPYIPLSGTPDYRCFHGELYIANNWLPAFNQEGVDLMLCGHRHTYKKVLPGEIENDFPVITGSPITVMQIDATNLQLVLTVKEYGNSVIDQFVIPVDSN